MKIFIKSFTTEIYPTEGEIRREALCNVGAGADTCIWLVASAQGFECTYHNKPLPLYDRFLKGETVAKKDGCAF